MTSSDRRRARGGPNPHGQLHGERVQLAIARELDSILRDEITDPDLDGARLLAVDLSRDGKIARCHVAIAEPRAVAARAGFSRAASFLRGRLAEALTLERTPELRFVVHPEGVT
jgi:ribosome-binding factor A